MWEKRACITIKNFNRNRSISRNTENTFNTLQIRGLENVLSLNFTHTALLVSNISLFERLLPKTPNHNPHNNLHPQNPLLTPPTPNPLNLHSVHIPLAPPSAPNISTHSSAPSHIFHMYCSTTFSFVFRAWGWILSIALNFGYKLRITNIHCCGSWNCSEINFACYGTFDSFFDEILHST